MLPLNTEQCFFISMFAFGVVGFRRGWRREVISLVFVLLAVVLVRPYTSDILNGFLVRLGNAIAYLSGSGQLTSSPPSSQSLSFLGGPFWSLVIFILIVALGYYIGYKAFEGPKTPHERFLGIIPALISGAFVLFYLSDYVTNTEGPGNHQIQVPMPDPSSFVPTIIIFSIISLITAFVASRLKKKK
jgi:hypothetical protein